MDIFLWVLLNYCSLYFTYYRYSGVGTVVVFWMVKRVAGSSSGKFRPESWYLLTRDGNLEGGNASLRGKMLGPFLGHAE